MKLYTEEQVTRQKKALQEVIDLWDCGLPLDLSTLRKCENALLQLTPIELPSDEEIRKQSLDKSLTPISFQLGAKWVINQIKQQDNGK